MSAGMIVLIVLGFLLGLVVTVLFVLGMCRVASDADEQEERMEREWEAKHGHD